MVESNGGRFSRPEDDEFEEAFGGLTAPAATTVQDFAVGPVPPVPETRVSPVFISGSREIAGPSSSEAPAAVSPPVEPPRSEPPAAVSPRELLEAAATEAPMGAEPKPDPDAPDEEQPSPRADGTEDMGSVFGAARPAARRASTRQMKEGLRHLFAPQEAPPVRPSEEESTSGSEHSAYFQEFVRSAALRRRVMPSGDPRLDDLLGGGLHPGLYLLSGSGARMQRAFLDNLMWGAVEQKHAVRYCAFDSGAQAVWERMIVALGSLIGEPVLPEELRVSTGDDDVSDRVGWIDAALVRNVLPYVLLRDSFGSDGQVSPSRFLVALDGWLIREGGSPLLIIDSLSGLDGLLSGEEELGDEAGFAGELDRLLRERSSVAVAAATADPEAGLSGVGQGHLLLGELDRSGDETTEWVALTVHDTGGVRSEVFAVDRITGLFG